MNLRQKNKKLKKEIERLKGMTVPINYIKQRHDIRTYCVEQKYLFDMEGRQIGRDVLERDICRGFMDVLPKIAEFEYDMEPGNVYPKTVNTTVRATIKFVMPEGRGLYD